MTAKEFVEKHLSKFCQCVISPELRYEGKIIGYEGERLIIVSDVREITGSATTNRTFGVNDSPNNFLKRFLKRHPQAIILSSINNGTKWTFFHINDCKIMEEPSKPNHLTFPHTCPKCHSPALELFTSVECSRGCR